MDVCIKLNGGSNMAYRLNMWVMSALIGALTLYTEVAQADWKPTIQMKKALDKSKQSDICLGPNNSVLPKDILKLVARAYAVDVLDLLDKQALIGLSGQVDHNVVIASWLKTSPVEIKKHLKKTSLNSLLSAQVGLGDYVLNGGDTSSAKDRGFLVRNVSVGGGTAPIPMPRNDWTRIEALMRSVLTSSATPSAFHIDCVIQPKPTTPTATKPDSNGDKEKKPIWVVRNQIDDVAVKKDIDGGSHFKKLKTASIAFTDNKETKTQTISIDTVVGVGTPTSTKDHLYGFLAYEHEDTDTDDPDDDDSSKDVNLLKPGVMWARSLAGGPNDRDTLFGSFGLVAYPAYDFAQDSEAFHLRAFINDITFNIPGGTAGVCGREVPLFNANISWNCRLNTFIEVVHVMEAGTNTDFATLEDDQYVGLGAEVGTQIGFGSVDALKPIVLKASYKYMSILEGDLDDPDRFTASIIYKIPKSNFEVGLTYEEGQNFDTFVDEEALKFTSGWKY